MRIQDIQLYIIQIQSLIQSDSYKRCEARISEIVTGTLNPYVVFFLNSTCVAYKDIMNSFIPIGLNQGADELTIGYFNNYLEA